MIIYQIVAKGRLALFGDSPQKMFSKEIYTSPPGDDEKEAFKKRCIKTDGAADMWSLDPNNKIEISIQSYDLIDNGDLL